MLDADIIDKMFLGMFSLLAAYFFWRVRRMETKLDECASKEDVHDIVDNKLDHIKADQRAIKEDLHYMRGKIDKISEYLLTRGRND